LWIARTGRRESNVRQSRVWVLRHAFRTPRQRECETASSAVPPHHTCQGLAALCYNKLEGACHALSEHAPEPSGREGRCGARRRARTWSDTPAASHAPPPLSPQTRVAWASSTSSRKPCLRFSAASPWAYRQRTVSSALPLPPLPPPPVLLMMRQLPWILLCRRKCCAAAAAAAAAAAVAHVHMMRRMP
jgi:hypothetical protein